MADLQEKRARLEAIEVQRKKRQRLVLISLCTLVVVGVVAVVLSTKEVLPGYLARPSRGSFCLR